MTRLRSAWVTAWATLGGEVPKQLTQRNGSPSRNVVRVLFPAVFGEIQPPGRRLEPPLRSQRVVFTERTITEVEADRILQATRLAKAELEATAALFGRLKAPARARGLGADAVDAHLLRHANEWVL